jgi:Rieske Fe-S protein
LDKNPVWVSGLPRINRRIFFRIGGISFLAGLGFIWTRLLDRQVEIERKPSLRRIKQPLQPGITFYDDFYTYKSEGVVKAFSTKCTHAGCQLNSEANGLITCPCHGSQFEASSGKPTKGPAIQPLRLLPCVFDSKTGEWIVMVRS